MTRRAIIEWLAFAVIFAGMCIVSDRYIEWSAEITVQREDVAP